ncbi:trypco2 family protein [Streptomyces cylindrosporus]|uniref:Trypsin-co-occurring domain-containing protein n=1 Tax=Streptomyces cylindrosporus TaxID=2927583 RepID=A0ABS9YII6_9ACTN|nr:trypco2 family protein [Streptomyces cylindrosporus]MCI3277024.1 hypothetical protein [Streptomyces cylindrosporus]
MQNKDLELAQAVAVLRDELLDAAALGAGSNLAFEVGPIELEFAVELRRDAKVKAGFKAWVLTADAEAGMSHGRIHRVKIALTPKQPGGGDLLIHSAPQQGIGPGDVSGRIPD